MLAPLANQLDTIDQLFAYFDQKAQSVSQAPVGWHLEHLLLVNERVAEALIQSNPTDYQWSFNWRKTIVLFTKKIPRGKAKAPKSARPEGKQSAEALQARIPALKLKLACLTTLHPNTYFVHPIFGKINLKTAIRFLFVHNQHHLKIMEEILAHNSKP